MFVSPGSRSLWSELSNKEKSEGIHPAKLGVIRFDISRSQFSVEQRRQIEEFFLGCRMATTELDYRARITSLLDSSDRALKPIMDIAQQILQLVRPEERKIQKRYHRYDVHLCGEGYGIELSNEIKKFAEVYNQLVEAKLSFLMHPARRLELLAYLGTTFSDMDRAADRLITYHCYGFYGLSISEMKWFLKKCSDKLKMIQSQLSALSKSEPFLIADLTALSESNLGCIPDAVCRKYVCLVYNKLASQRKLDILDLPEKKLCRYDPITLVHPDLSSLAEDYKYESSPLGPNFLSVIFYLKTLRSGDLLDLMRCCLREEEKDLKRRISGIVDHELPASQRNYEFQLSGKLLKTYEQGDFSFVNDDIDTRLTKGYHIVDRLDVWQFFDDELPRNRDGLDLTHPTIATIIEELKDLNDIELILNTMRSIRKKGWDAFVSKCLESYAEELGVLNRAWMST